MNKIEIEEDLIKIKYGTKDFDLTKNELDILRKKLFPVLLSYKLDYKNPKLIKLLQNLKVKNHPKNVYDVYEYFAEKSKELIEKIKGDENEQNYEPGISLEELKKFKVKTIPIEEMAEYLKCTVQSIKFMKYYIDYNNKIRYEIN